MRMIVTTMKDEGPFVLEWVAHHLGLGFDHILLCSNDCSDGTDLIARRLEALGLATHIDNPGPWKAGPQGAAYDRAMAHPKLAEAEWIFVCDADEFLNISAGDGTLDALFAAVPGADVISFVWRLFGHSGRVAFEDGFVTEQFTHAAHPYQQRPSMCQAIKTLYRADAGFRTLSTHRPKGPRRGWRRALDWRDADGDQMAAGFGQYGWHATNGGVGFGRALGQVNHYAVRSIQSYLMKRLRGDVRTGAFHPKLEDSGVAYWALHCWNVEEDRSILQHGARTRARYDALLADPELARLQRGAVDHHRAQAAKIAQTEAAQTFEATFRDYRGAFDWEPGLEAVTCPEMAMERAVFSVEIYRAQLRFERVKAVKLARRHKRLPWFANLDALGVDFSGGKPGAEALQPVTEAVLQDCRPEVSVTRPKRRQMRLGVLEQLGKRGTPWAVIGSGDVQLARDILKRAAPAHLMVLNPWGYDPDAHTIPVSGRVLDPAQVAIDMGFFAYLEAFEAELQSGGMSVIRSDPYYALKTLRPGGLEAVYLADAMPEERAVLLLSRVVERLAEGGVMILDGYHRRGRHGDAMQRALHRVLAEKPGGLRIQALEGAHCVVQKLPPM